MAKRYMPSLDGLDAGERPVLGLRDRADLDEIRSPLLGDGFEYADLTEDAASSALDALFDPYE